MLFTSIARNTRRVVTACALALGFAVAAHSASAAGTIVLNAEAAQTAAGTQFTMLTATGSYSGPFTNPPASPFTFQVDNGQVIPAGCSSYNLTGICQVNYPTASLTPGTHTIKVVYAGDATYGAASSTSSLFVTSSSVHYIAINVAYTNTTYGVATAPVSAAVTVPGGILPQNLYSIAFSIDGGAPVLASCVLTNGVDQATCTANVPTTGLQQGYHSILFNVPSDSYYTTAQQGGDTLLLK